MIRSEKAELRRDFRDATRFARIDKGGANVFEAPRLNMVLHAAFWFEEPVKRAPGDA